MPEKLISPSLRLSVTSPSLPDAWSPVSPGIMLYTPLSTPSVAASQHARPEALPPNDVQHDNKDNGGKMPVAVVADDRPDSCGAETSSLSSSSSSTPSLSLHHPPPPLPSPAGLHFPSPLAYAAAAASIPASTSSLSAPKRTPFALSLDHGPSESPSHLVLDQSSLTGSDLTGFSSPMDGSRSSPDPPGHSPASPSSSIANIPRRTSVEATSTTSQQQQRTSAALPIPVASSPSASSASTTNRHRVPNPSSPLSRSILHDDSEDDDATLCPETATTQTVSSASRRTPSTHAGSPRPKSLPPFPSSSRGSGSAPSAGHSGPLKSPCFVHGYLAHSPFMPDFSGSVSGTSASDSNAHHQRAGPAGAGGSHVSPSSSLTSTTTSTSSHMGASPISPSSSLTGASSVAASTMGLHSSSSSASGAYEAKASSSSDRPSASQLHPSSHLAHSGNNTHDLAPHRTKSQLRLEGYEEAEDGVLVEPPTADGEDGAHERAEDESLTRQLAETAVGVREMAKALGRTTVRSRIQNVLIVTKARDNRLIKLTRELAIFLMNKIRNDSSPVGVSSASKRGLTVYVDAQLRNSKRFDAVGIERDYPQFFVPFERRRSSSSASVNTESGFLSGAATPNGFYNGNSNGSTASPSELGQLRYWTSDICSRSPHLFDFVVTLGGDGTVLFTSWLFQKIVPPVLPFALGSLGFLTNFDFANFSSVMDSVIDKGIRVNLRMRFTCTVYRAVAPEDDQARKKSVKAVKNAEGEILMSQVGKSGWEALEGGVMGVPNAVGLGEKKRDKEIMCFTTRPVEQFEVLNDLVVDRGPSPYVSLLELFGDEHHMTTVQADGLTVSTPTGSTAYSLSAGGSLVHPEIPALLITPICPHTLSFRPMLLPDSMELRICVPYNSRSTAWASFDGRGRVELKQGDHIKVTASKYPFPTVCADKQSTDWFHAIQRTLRWNEREKQKSFVVIEEPRAPKPLQPPRPLRAPMASVPKLSLNTGDEAEILESREGSEHLTDGREGGGSAITDEDQGEPEKLKEEEEEEEEDEKFDIDDSSSVAEPSAPVSPPMSATSSNGESSINHHRGPAGRPFDPSLHFTSATPAATFLPLPASGVASPDRFAPGPGRPHPPKLSPRHLTEALTKAAEDSSGASLPASSSHHHLEEKGQRDDINSGPGALRASGSRIPRQAERDLPLPPGSDAELRTPKPHQRMPVPHQHLVSPHRIVAAHHHQLQGHSSGPRRTASWGRRERRQREERAAAEQQEKDDQGPSRAFAFFGQDESDSGLSEGESDGGY